MKILLGYSYYKSQRDVKTWVEAWLARLSSSEIQITPFCLTLDPPGPRLSWNELDNKWKYGDKKLYSLYERLLEACQDYDIFINWNGINLHPDIVKKMPLTTVYSCFDDPESSNDLSKPVAWAYDLCLVGNIAEVDTYRKWGIRNVHFWPLGFFEGECDHSITEEQILSSERDIDLSLLCERESQRRNSRLDSFTSAFPQGHYYGRGWDKGFLNEEDKLPLYRRTKIGPNFHNSTGPINFRTYILPANGVMLLCDNKSHLAELYELGVEAVGFDTVEEAIELCQYYLEHDDERRRIAVAGWKRAIRDYNEVSAFSIGLEHILALPTRNKGLLQVQDVIYFLRKRQLKGTIKYWSFYVVLHVVRKIIQKIKYIYENRA